MAGYTLVLLDRIKIHSLWVSARILHFLELSFVSSADVDKGEWRSQVLSNIRRLMVSYGFPSYTEDNQTAPAPSVTSREESNNLFGIQNSMNWMRSDE